jgi:hypothetical protein
VGPSGFYGVVNESDKAGGKDDAGRFRLVMGFGRKLKQLTLQHQGGNG